MTPDPYQARHARPARTMSWPAAVATIVCGAMFFVVVLAGIGIATTPPTSAQPTTCQPARGGAR